VKASTATNAALKKNAQIYVSSSGGNSSIIGPETVPVTSSHHNHVQLKLLNKQASTLMKMYGNSGNMYRKHYKSVERKQPNTNTTSAVAAGGYSNYKMY
jgi:hypothetical protein